MLGTFQQSSLRIEVEASEALIRDSLTRSDQLQQWMVPQRLSSGLPESLQTGTVFTSWFGPIAVHHHVDLADSRQLRLLMSQGVDGFHYWSWGDGWVQSTVEGISLLPLSLGQTFSLLRLKQFLTSKASNQ